MSLNLLNDGELLRLKEFYQAFEINLDWDDLLFIKRKSSVWVMSRGLEAFVSASDKFDTCGLRVFSGESFPYKPTFAFFQFFRPRRRIIEMEDCEVNAFIHGGSLKLDEKLKGYYGVKNRGRFIGVGLGKEFELLSQVPKKISKQITKK